MPVTKSSIQRLELATQRLEVSSRPTQTKDKSKKVLRTLFSGTPFGRSYTNFSRAPRGHAKARPPIKRGGLDARGLRCERLRHLPA
jgi:hypothetical protein